jgi:hypothetical protein
MMRILVRDGRPLPPPLLLVASKRHVEGRPRHALVPVSVFPVLRCVACYIYFSFFLAPSPQQTCTVHPPPHLPFIPYLLRTESTVTRATAARIKLTVAVNRNKAKALKSQENPELLPGESGALPVDQCPRMGLLLCCVRGARR